MFTDIRFTEIAALSLLAVIAILLTTLLVIAVRYIRNRQSIITDSLRQAIAELNKAITHHAQVAAVVALIEQYDDRPELFDNLADYSDQVVGAALFHRVNALAAALKDVNDKLVDTYRLHAQDTLRFSATMWQHRKRWRWTCDCSSKPRASKRTGSRAGTTSRREAQGAVRLQAG